MSQGFLRQETERHSRIGRGRRKLQKWRRPRGRHSKIRRKRFGYPVKVMIGFGTPKDKPVQTLVHNIKELSLLQKNSEAIIAKAVGAKSKIEMLKMAQEKGIKIVNLGGKK